MPKQTILEVYLIKVNDSRNDGAKKTGLNNVRKLFGPDAGLGYAFVIPLLVFAIGLLIYPFFSAVFLSFQDKLVGQAPRFIGLANYKRLLSDTTFLNVLRNTLVYSFSAVGIKIVFGMGMALTLNESFRGRGLARGLLLLPWVMPDLVVAMTWRWIFDGTYGVLNYILKSAGLIEANIAWLSVPSLGLSACIIANAWRGFPFFGITFLAGLQTISKELYEAAEVDGASVFRRFLHITLPSLRPVILVGAILSLIWTFNDFTLVWSMTGGGPLDKTHIFATYTYELGFLNNRIGNAMSVTVAMIPVLVLFILVLVPQMWKED